MAQEGSPQGVVSLSSLQEAQGKAGRGVIREQRACRGGPRPHCLPVNSDFLGSLLHIVPSQRRGTEGKRRGRLGKGLFQTLFGPLLQEYLGSHDHGLSLNLSFFLPSLITPLCFKHFQYFCAEPRSSNLTAQPLWAGTAESSLLPSSPITPSLETSSNLLLPSLGSVLWRAYCGLS